MTTTLKCSVVAKEQDLMGYQSLVFKNLDNAPFGHNYILTTVWPNWQSRIPDIGENGYLTYDFVEAGVDKWYNRETDSFVPYNFTNIIFIKFVKEVDNSKKDIII